jgi:hypothetical protein
MRTKSKRPSQTDTIRVSMSRSDAEDLRATCYRVGGPPYGPRGAFDRLDAALLKAGVKQHEKLVAADAPIFLSYNTYRGD